MNIYCEGSSLEVLEANQSPPFFQADSSACKDPFTRLYCMTGGHGSISFGHKTVPLVSGKLFLIPSYFNFIYHWESGMQQRWLHFRFSIFGGMDLFSGINKPLETDIADPHLTDHLFSRAIEMSQSQDPVDLVEQEACINLLLLPFLKAVQSLPRRNAGQLSRLTPVLEFISNNAERDIKVPELAKIAGLETSRFSVVFKEATGIPPAEFIRRKRIELVRESLLYSDKPLATIAAETGFCDAFHLSRTFKKLLGVSPNDYRNQKHLF